MTVTILCKIKFEKNIYMRKSKLYVFQIYSYIIVERKTLNVNRINKTMCININKSKGRRNL